MKKITRVFCSFLAFLMIFQSSFVAFAQTSNSPFTNNNYNHSSKYDGVTIQNGIDVSQNNGTIDWTAVASSGTVQYAFIRVGRTGYMSDFAPGYDTNYSQNILGATSVGIPVGVYWYSQAKTVSEAQTEANMLVSVLSSYNISLPVVLDYEFSGNTNGRLDSAWANKSVTKSELTQNAIAFCNVIESAGYTPCIYATKSFLTEQLDYVKLQKSYKIWLAHYTKESNYDGYCEYWQYSKSGYINGISTTVDCNFRYLYDQVSKVNSLYKKPKTSSISKLTKGKKQFKITFKKISSINGYQISYSTSKKFTKKTTKTITVSLKSKTKTIKKLKSKKKYYVRIRTYKTVYGSKIYSSWSKVKTVTTK